MMTSRKILLVDDDAELSEALIDQLSLYDEFELTRAATAAAGLQAAREGHVDLIIMDCLMPIMDGYEAARAIRKREAESGERRTPIVALTANAFDEDAERSRAAGMDGHMAKPYTRAQLRELLVTWL